MQVTISATSIGGNAGPFNIYQNFDSYGTPVATSVSRASILAGYVVTVNDATTTIRLTSTGTCTNSTDISVIYPSPTPTPTVTPSKSPVVNIISWSYNKNVADASMLIYKNGSNIAGSSTNGDSGTFSHSPGDTIEIYSYASIKTFDYTSVCVAKGGVSVTSDESTDTDSYVSFTTTAGTYIVNICENTSIFACTCVNPE